MSTTTAILALTFKLSSDQRHLLAVFTPEDGYARPEVAAIRECLAQQGFAKWPVSTDDLNGLIDQMDAATAPFERAISECVDGAFRLTMEQDDMVARMSLTAPRGGTAVTLADVRQALAEKGVVNGVLESAIEAALAKGDAEGCVVAQGIPPVSGKEASFETLVSMASDRRPKVDERGVADYRDLGQLVVVKQGTPLMRRTPATPGTFGKDLMGRPIPPLPGRDIPFAPGLMGAEISPDDPHLLQAAVTGQPVIIRYGVMVEPSVSFPRVDMSSGNVGFDGSVCVNGDVKEGMKIVASGDVYVAGVVEAADIEAGGNVVIKGGVIGRSSYSGELSESAANHSARIRAKGSINVRYAEHTRMEAGADIFIDDFAMHCDLIAMNQIQVGKPGTQKGHLIGGRARAVALLKVGSLGSKSNLLTKVQVGYNPYLQNQIKAVETEIEANQKEQQGLKKIIDFVQLHPERNKDGLLDKAKGTLDKLTEDLHKMQELLQALIASHMDVSKAYVVVQKEVHGGAVIQLGDRKWETLDRVGSGVFKLVDGEIECGSVTPT